MTLSHCVIHNTYPEPGEPCWSCANPFIDAAESRAAQLEAERDEARAALTRYQDERVQLLSRIEELAARVKELEDSDASFSRDLSEALNSGDGVYRP